MSSPKRRKLSQLPPVLSGFRLYCVPDLAQSVVAVCRNVTSVDLATRFDYAVEHVLAEYQTLIVSNESDLFEGFIYILRAVRDGILNDHPSSSEVKARSWSSRCGNISFWLAKFAIRLLRRQNGCTI